MTFDEILERAVIGAQRTSELPAERLRVIAEAAFAHINNALAVVYAANEDKRSMLRTDLPLVFVGGSVAIPANVLMDYLKDSTLALSTGVASLVEPYADFLRTRDNRLQWWAFNDMTLSAKENASNGGGNYAGTATLTCIVAPDVPASAGATFTGPDDYTLELIKSLTTYLEAQTE